MKKFVLVAVMSGSLVSGQAIAACDTSSRLDTAAINTLLGGNTVCVPSVNANPMIWQELHVGASGGALIDFKRGPGHAVDPSETVGIWTVASNGGGNKATVTHNYGAGGSYTYSVHSISVINSIYGFCPIAGGPEIVARVKTSGGAC